MGPIASQITSLTIVYSTVYSDAYQKKTHQSSASLAFAGNSPVTQKMFPLDNVITTLILVQEHNFIAIQISFLRKHLKSLKGAFSNGHMPTKIWYYYIIQNGFNCIAQTFFVI